jgi:beta-glucosidase
LEASVATPICSLIGYERVQLNPGQSKQISFTITPEMMMLFNDEGKQVLEPGRFRLTVGGSSPSPRSLVLGAPQPVSAEFEIR